MLHKYSLKYLLFENTDIPTAKDKTSLQGDITEIFTLILLESPVTNVSWFLPSNVYKPKTVTNYLGQTENVMPLKHLEQFQIYVKGDWLEKLKEIYERETNYKDPKAIDDLFQGYFVMAKELARHIKNYLSNSNLRFTSESAWIGRDKANVLTSTADIKLVCEEYPKGIMVSLKSSNKSRLLHAQKQNLGLYEEFGIDTTTDAREKVNELKEIWKSERDAFVNKLVSDYVLYDGLGGFASDAQQRAQGDPEYQSLDQNRQIKENRIAEINQTTEATEKQILSNIAQMEKRIAKLEADLEISLEKKSGKIASYYDTINRFKLQLPLVRERVKLKTDVKLLKKKMETRLKEIEIEERVKWTTNQIQSQGWNNLYKPKAPKTKNFSPEIFVKRSPDFDSKGWQDGAFILNSSTIGSKDEWEALFRETCKDLNSKQIEKMLNDPEVSGILIDKFVRRQKIPNDVEGALHLIVHSKVGIVPKSDVDFLQEFLRDEDNPVESIKNHDYLYKFEANDASGARWNIMTIRIQGSIEDVNRVQFEVNPQIKIKTMEE